MNNINNIVDEYKNMVEQLKELLEMQKALDEAIFKERGIDQYPYDEMKVALVVELGELMNELPSKFKVWKKNPVDNREKALEEYIDCLSFKMNILNYQMQTDNKNDLLPLSKYEECKLKTFDLLSLIHASIFFDDFYYIFALGNRLGFTWEEIYNAYKRKNQVNYERLKSGY